MGFKSLMVHLDPGRSNENLLLCAADLAERFDARVIGITACSPPITAYADIVASGELFEMERDEIEQETVSAESEFEAAFRGRKTHVEWRSAKDDADVTRYIARQARNADLLLTSVVQDDPFDRTRAAHIGALVMQIGRPVLLVPSVARIAGLARVLVAWKDTRDTRRAVADALPLLRQADVTIAEVANQGHMEAARRHLDDVVAWFMQHGVAAKAYPVASTGDDATDLSTTADRERCDLIVAGAYGHSRVREWMLGGVTKDLLMSSRRCALVSH
jgi:nucleotide-binding universal stress UspA family protein